MIILDFIKKPQDIEKRSFEIITEELGKTYDDRFVDAIIKRVIHTTADFEYAEIIEIHPDVVKSIINAIKSGCKIYGDTQMVMSGINKRRLAKYGVEVCNFVHDEDVVKEAKELGVTRSMVSIKKACKDESVKIFAIGNAPTAIFALKQLIDEGYAKPDAIIGVPVGFVGAAESKELVKELGVPYIITRGRKGGSPVAATIINAILYQMDE